MDKEAIIRTVLAATGVSAELVPFVRRIVGLTLGEAERQRGQQAPQLQTAAQVQQHRNTLFVRAEAYREQLQELGERQQQQQQGQRRMEVEEAEAAAPPPSCQQGVGEQPQWGGHGQRAGGRKRRQEAVPEPSADAAPAGRESHACHG